MTVNTLNPSDVEVGDYVSIHYFGEIGDGNVEGVITKKNSIGIYGKHPTANKYEWFVVYYDIVSIVRYHTDFDLGI